jgi:hypothetical protein
MARRHPRPQDIAAVLKWEQGSLADYFWSMAAVGDDAEMMALWQGVRALVFAQSPRDVMDVIAANPRLLTERADAILDMTQSFAEITSMPFAPAILRDRREWLTRMREVSSGGSRPGPPDV